MFFLTSNGNSVSVNVYRVYSNVNDQNLIFLIMLPSRKRPLEEVSSNGDSTHAPSKKVFSETKGSSPPQQTAKMREVQLTSVLNLQQEIEDNMHEGKELADPGFSWGGGGGGGRGQKNMCVHAHHKRESRSPLRPRSRSRLRALEAVVF